MRNSRIAILSQSQLREKGGAHPKPQSHYVIAYTQGWFTHGQVFKRYMEMGEMTEPWASAGLQNSINGCECLQQLLHISHPFLPLACTKQDACSHSRAQAQHKLPTDLQDLLQPPPPPWAEEHSPSRCWLLLRASQLQSSGLSHSPWGKMWV